jgi:hypothetical protein
MKKVLLLGLALVLGLAVVSQAQLRTHGIPTKVLNQKAISVDPVPVTQASTVITPKPNRTKSANVVDIITLGTAANALG